MDLPVPRIVVRTVLWPSRRLSDVLAGLVPLADAVVTRLVAEVVARVDLDEAVSRVDLDAAASRLDVDAVVGRVDFEPVLDRLDLTAIVLRRVDLEAVVREVLACLDEEELRSLVDRVDVGGVEVDVVNTHLGLVPHEQRAQADALMSPDWMAHEECTDPAILLGDFNATSRHAAYRRIAARLRDAKRVVRRGRLATFPARLPMIRIDHVFVSRSIQVTGVHAPRNRLTREASDHLPLIVDFLEQIEAGASPVFP